MKNISFFRIKSVFILFLGTLLTPILLFSNTTQVESFISRLYENIFERSADEGGMNYWKNEIHYGTTATETAKFFYRNQEMQDLNLSDDEFIKRTYRTFFDREADTEGYAYWLDQVKNRGKLRDQLLYGFALSNEFIQVCDTYGITAYDKEDQLYAFIERFYNLTLQRSADHAGLTFWFTQLKNEQKTPNDIAKDFFFSQEFLAKNVNDEEFMTLNYRTLMDREPDPGGLSYWLQKLQEGTTRDSILNDFIASNEFQSIIEKFLGDSQNPNYDYEYTEHYKGLRLYAKNRSISEYKLEALSQEEFNALDNNQKIIIADKLLSSLYFGIPYYELKSLIDSGNFITTIQDQITQESNDLSKAEEFIANKEYFNYPSWGTSEVTKILARFYALEKLDKHYIDFWSAYVLSQTIMFSPSYELESSHNPNITRVYSRLVRNFRDENTLGYSTFLHMTNDDNWRRFRSPEDNGREMLEIYLLDFNDSHVPIAGKALKNWKLDRDYDTLVIGLDENREPLNLFGVTIYNGFDFYRELAKSDAFMSGVILRLADVYFPTFTKEKKDQIVSDIISSNPKTWQDILLQIVFSKEYLFNSDKPKSAEEVFYSLSKKMNYKHDQYLFLRFSNNLESMGQASMKYKLGKKEEVPLDTQSFMSYHKFIREEMLLSVVSDSEENEYGWGTNGWRPKEYISNDKFSGIGFNEYKKFVDSLADYIFLSTISRTADSGEKALFEKYMLKDNGEPVSLFELNKLDERVQAAVIMLDFVSRLKETYRYQKVEQ